MWIPVFAAGIINGFGHWFGYKNFKRDEYNLDGSVKYPNVAFSSNIIPVGIIIGGEELHNNHHVDAASPFFARKWWEFDLGSVTIRLLCLLRLANLRIPLVGNNKIKIFYYRVFNLGE